jgi:hypothetical protein
MRIADEDLGAPGLAFECLARGRILGRQVAPQTPLLVDMHKLVCKEGLSAALVQWTGCGWKDDGVA